MLDLSVEPFPRRNLGKYGFMWLRYLQDHKSDLYAALLRDGKLYAHMLEVEDAANDLLDSIVITVENDQRMR